MTTARVSRTWRTILPVITIFSLSFPAYAKYSGGTGEGIINFMLEKSKFLSVTDSADAGG